MKIKVSKKVFGCTWKWDTLLNYIQIEIKDVAFITVLHFTGAVIAS